MVQSLRDISTPVNGSETLSGHSTVLGANHWYRRYVLQEQLNKHWLLRGAHEEEETPNHRPCHVSIVMPAHLLTPF